MEQPNTETPRVFVPQEPARRIDGAWHPIYDLTHASTFGTPVLLTTANVSMFFPVPIVRDLKEKLRTFSDRDYIVAIGDPTLLAVVSMLAAARNNGRVQLLKWDRKRAIYVPVQIDISGRAT